VRAEHKASGDEWDAFTSWRRVLPRMFRPGVRKGIKRASHKKDRRGWQTDAHAEAVWLQLDHDDEAAS